MSVSGYPGIYRSKAGYHRVMAGYDAALRRFAVPHETRMVETRHGQTHVVVGGDPQAPPVVLFHGWDGSAAECGSLFPFLFSSFRVHIPDVIGQTGKSAPCRPKTSGPAYADWACDVLDALDLPQTIVMGSSGGGWLTLKFTAYYPRRVTRAVALATDGLSGLNLWGLLPRFPVAMFPNQTTMKWFIELLTAPTTPKGELVKTFAELALAKFKNYKIQRNPGLLTPGEVQQITAPVLVLMGEYERTFKLHEAIEQAKKIPGLIAAEIVPNAGHLMMVDQPAWLERRILRFIRELK